MTVLIHLPHYQLQLPKRGTTGPLDLNQSKRQAGDAFIEYSAPEVVFDIVDVGSPHRGGANTSSSSTNYVTPQEAPSVSPGNQKYREQIILKRKQEVRRSHL